MLTQGLFEPEVELEWSATRPGMAHFAATGPAEARCADCRYLGPANGMVESASCRKYEEITKRHGPKVFKRTPACRYFARRP